MTTFSGVPLKVDEFKPPSRAITMFSDYIESGAPLLGSESGHRLTGKFRFSGARANMTIANTLRRCIVTSTRSVGFSPEIIIRKNTSVIPNEMLAHRLTMLPLAVRNIDAFDPTKYKFELQAKNSRRSTGRSESLLHVKASDFRVFEKQGSGEFEDAGPYAVSAMFPPDPITHDTCLLVSLKTQMNVEYPDEQIDLTATAVIGTSLSTNNIAFSPVSQCTFANTLDTDEARRREFFNKWLAISKKVEDPAKLTPEELAHYKREWGTLEYQRCFLVDEKGEPNSFDFTIESVGVRPVPDIVAEGIGAVIALVDPYADITKTFADLDVSFFPPLSRMENGIELSFNGQEHTLGVLLQQIISEMDESSGISYVGYKVPHPLERKMSLILKFNEEPTEEKARTLIATAAGKAKEIFTGMAGGWAALHNLKVDEPKASTE